MIVRMVESFRASYREIKRNWLSLIGSSSKCQVRNVINEIIFLNHVRNFDSDEWGPLQDYNCLQDCLESASKTRISSYSKDLSAVISEFSALSKSLDTCVSSLRSQSAPGSAVCLASSIAKIYWEELQVRESIVRDLSDCTHFNSPYEVLSTVSILWSRGIYVNGRDADSAEKLLECEITSGGGT